MDEPQARLTVVEQVYHQLPGENPTHIESKFYRLLDTAEQLYSRRTKATETWQALDHGWVEQAATVIVLNNEGRFLAAQPTEEEQTEADCKVLEIAFGDYGDNPADGGRLLVPPGESTRICPDDLNRLCIRSQYGETRFTVTVIPA